MDSFVASFGIGFDLIDDPREALLQSEISKSTCLLNAHLTPLVTLSGQSELIPDL